MYYTLLQVHAIILISERRKVNLLEKLENAGSDRFRNLYKVFQVGNNRCTLANWLCNMICLYLHYKANELNQKSSNKGWIPTCT